MKETRFEQSLKLLAGTRGRRDAVRSLGAVGMALLAALGLVDSAAAKKRNHGGKGDGPILTEKKGKKKRGPTGPTGPTGPAGPSRLSVRRLGDLVTGPGDPGNQGKLTSRARCQVGEHAVGGGFAIDLVDFTTVSFFVSEPGNFGTSDEPLSWTVEIIGGGSDKLLQASVICVPN